MKTDLSLEQQKNVYVVLGMPRSGTSAVTRGLKALGIDLGKTLTPAHHEWNPKGYFEDTDIVYKINRRLIAMLDAGTINEYMIENQPGDHEALLQVRNNAAHLLQKRVEKTQHWAFKDPRTSKTIYFWRPIFEALNLNDQYVITLRNPLASAYSFKKYINMDVEEGMIAWLMHLIPAIDGTFGKNRVIVSYEAMLENPRLQLDRIRSNLVFPLVPNPRDIDIYATEFLDKKLRHHEFSDGDLKSHPTALVAPLCADVFALLSRLAKDELTFHSQEFQTAWQQIKADFATAQPMYQYVDNLIKRRKAPERNMRIIHKSIPWKFIYPLRFIDDLLRARRRAAKDQGKTASIYA
jgi:hypothetical protein